MRICIFDVHVTIQTRHTNLYSQADPKCGAFGTLSKQNDKCSTLLHVQMDAFEHPQRPRGRWSDQDKVTWAKAVPRKADKNKQETAALLFILANLCFAYLRMHLEIMKA